MGAREPPAAVGNCIILTTAWAQNCMVLPMHRQGDAAYRWAMTTLNEIPTDTTEEFAERHRRSYRRRQPGHPAVDRAPDQALRHACRTPAGDQRADRRRRGPQRTLRAGVAGWGGVRARGRIRPDHADLFASTAPCGGADTFCGPGQFGPGRAVHPAARRGRAEGYRLLSQRWRVVVQRLSALPHADGRGER